MENFCHKHTKLDLFHYVLKMFFEDLRPRSIEKIAGANKKKNRFFSVFFSFEKYKKSNFLPSEKKVSTRSKNINIKNIKTFTYFYCIDSEIIMAGHFSLQIRIPWYFSVRKIPNIKYKSFLEYFLYKIKSGRFQREQKK